MKKGKYYVFVEIDWDCWTQQKKYRNFSLNCYGAGETQLKVCEPPQSVSPKLYKTQILEKIFKARVETQSEYVVV